jgi:hypothetical protein
VIAKDNPFIVGARERFYIDKMDVLRNGINKIEQTHDPPPPLQFTVSGNCNFYFLII